MKIRGSDWQTAAIVPTRKLGIATYKSVQGHIDVFNSTGLITGGVLSDGGSQQVAITNLTGSLRTTDSHVGDVVTFDLSGIANQAIPTDTIRYIGIEYNAGSPQVVVKNTDDWNMHDEFPLGSVVNESDSLHIINNPQFIANFAAHGLQRFYETAKLSRDARSGGIALGETGTRNVTVSPGTLWDRVNEFTIAAIDTSGADRFDSYSAGGQESTGNAQWDNDNYDNGGVLTSLNASKWANLWWYIESDGDLVCVYGTAEHTNQASAENETVPTALPDRLVAHGRLIGRFVFQKSAGTAASIESAFTEVLVTSGVTDHGDLAGLADDDHPQYILHSLADVANDFLVASGANTFAKKTLAETGAILEGDIDHGNIQGLGTGADHSYIDQDVTSGAAPTFAADNLSDGGGNAIVTTTQETNWDNHLADNSQAHTDYALHAGDTYSGVHDFGGVTTLEIPNSTGPSLSVLGQIAIDSNGTAADYDDAQLTFHDGTRQHTVIAVRTGELTTSDNHIIVYDAASNRFIMEAQTGGAGGGATTALDNLASVAINTALVSDTDITDDLGTGDIRWRDIYSTTLRSGLTAADTLKLEARDVDGSSWKTFLTITSANTPTADLDIAVTIGGNSIAYAGGAFHDGFSDFVANEHLDWTASVGTIHIDNIADASTAVQGVVELATAAETTTGTDATRAVTPDGLAGSDYGKRTIGLLLTDPNGGALTTGDSKSYFRVPSWMNGWNLVEVALSASDPSSSGIPTIQVRRSRRVDPTTRGDADMLSTKVTVDANEYDSIDAATPAVINGANDDVATGDHVHADADVAGTGALGVFVEVTFQKP